MQTEPTLEQIDDYNGKESKEKRNTINIVIISLIIISAIYVFTKIYNSTVDDYIGTPANPGINTTK
jgi:hypothetical protein